MIKIPPEVQIRATIKSGSVYYFVEESFSSDEPHYFISLNNPQQTEDTVVLVCSSSQIAKVRRRRQNLPNTTVEISVQDYSGFPQNSIVDCNTVLKKKVDTLIGKLERGELKLKKEMDGWIVEELKKAALQSTLVEYEVKKLLT